MGTLSESQPDFLSIGSARCGSTWLAERLRRHSGVWIPPIKEIHYFDMQRVLPPWHWIRLRRYGIHLRRYATHLLRKDEGRGRHFGHELRWGLRYFLCPRSDEWYRKVLTPPAGLLSGEVTPAYCMLDDQAFQDLADAFPSTKFIFAMRNPMERDWSQAVMNLRLHRRREAPEAYLKEILEVLARKEVVARSSYLDVLARLDRLESERVHVFFFDGIRDDPFGTLGEICDFLGIDADERMLDESATRKVATRGMGERAMPGSVRLMLAQRWLPMIDRLSARFGGPPTAWAEAARETIAGAGR